MKEFQTIVKLDIPFGRGVNLDFLPFHANLDLNYKGVKINFTIKSFVGGPIGSYVNITGDVGDKHIEFKASQNASGGGINGHEVNEVLIGDTLLVIYTWASYFRIDLLKTNVENKGA